MPYLIEVLAIKQELYPIIETACKSLNRVQGESEFIFRVPGKNWKDKLYLQKREEYDADTAFGWIKKYQQEVKGNLPFVILVVDGFLRTKNLANIFGTHSAGQGLAIFTVHNFGQFVNDMVRYIRYYLVRYAISFIAPEILTHNDEDRRSCIFHKKINKIEIKESLDSGEICSICYDKLRSKINLDINTAIIAMLQLVSNQHPFAVVIKGGGAKGLAFAGALLELEEFFSFDTFAGTSAGAIAAVMMGVGYKPAELLEILEKKDFRDFLDAGPIRKFYNLLKIRALYPGDAIEEWMNTMLKAKMPEKLSEILLKEMPYHTIVYSARVGEGLIHFDSKDTRRDAETAFATRCSMSIPFFFAPKTVDGKKVVDGGLRANFALNVFMQTYPNKPVIGLYLINSSKKGGASIIDLMNIAIDGEEVPIVEQNLNKVVIIDPRPISTTDFNLTPDKKELLILAGRLGALRFIARNHPDFEIDTARIPRLEAKIEELRQKINPSRIKYKK